MKKSIVLPGLLLFFVFASPAAAGVERLTVRVDGLACPFCAYGIEKKLKQVEGVGDVIVDMQGGTVSLAARSGRSIDFSRVPAEVRESGFTPREIRIRVSGSVEKRDGRLRLTWDGRSLPLAGLEGTMRQSLLAAAQSGKAILLTGSIYEQRAGVWAMTPEAAGGEAP